MYKKSWLQTKTKNQIKKIAGNLGIPVKGLSTAAIINKIVKA
jgi:hypothetical protein